MRTGQKEHSEQSRKFQDEIEIRKKKQVHRCSCPYPFVERCS